MIRIRILLLLAVLIVPGPPSDRTQRAPTLPRTSSTDDPGGSLTSVDFG
jgi:hypothetical protein